MYASILRNLHTLNDRNGNPTYNWVDFQNRLVRHYTNDGYTFYTYDPAGRLTQVRDGTGTYSFTYDNLGRLTQTTTSYSFLTARNFTVSYTYDAASNRVSMTDPEGTVTTYGYDTLNRLTSISNAWAGTFGFGYDALSRRTSLTRPNGVSTTYSYDLLSRLLAVTHQAGGATLDGASYTYDAAGNRTSKTDLYANVTSNYSYDNVYQLTGVTQGPTTTESYTYDAVGNRLSSLGVSPYAYNSSNELTSTPSATYSDDHNGNLTSRTDATGTTSYSWDYSNRLTKVTLPGSGGTVTFQYDPFGRRIQKSGPNGTVNYLYDGPNLLEEVDSSGNVLARYTQFPSLDQPLAELRGGVTSHYEQDGIASVSALSNSSGALANTYRYDSFGNLTASTGSITNPFQYTGRDYDPETGLRYYSTRYFDPTIGRFINEDMAHFEGGSNFYRYMRNSPTRFIDPFGLAEVKPQDMASLQGLFPGYTPLSKTGIVVPMPCDRARKILEQNGFYSSDNWPSIPTPVPMSGGLSIPGNPFLFWDPIAHSGGWEFRKPDGMHIRMKYPNLPCDKTCTLDEAHNDNYNPMYDPWGHFWYELVPYVVSTFPAPGQGPPPFF